MFSISTLTQAGTVETMVNPEVINAGVGGNNTMDLIARIQHDCLDHKPDLTILMAGTNDMNSKKYVPLNEYEKNMQQMIIMMKKIKSEVLLLNLLPVYEPYLFARHDKNFYEPEGHSGRLLEMNASIERMAKQNKIAFLNMFHIFNRVGNVSTAASSFLKNEINSKIADGLHPTAEGYRLMSVSVHAQITCRQLARNKKIVCFGDSITKGDGVTDGQNYPAYLQKLLK